MERRPHPFSVQQCRKFRLCCSLCIGTCSEPHWPRRSASRPSSTRLMGWTSWWRAFGLCLIDQLANHPRRTSRKTIANELEKKGGRVPVFGEEEEAPIRKRGSVSP